MADLISDSRVGSLVGDQCEFGQAARGAAGKPAPVKKATRFLSSAPYVLKQLAVRCSGNHAHQSLLGGRAAAAAVYPPGLCKAIVLGAEAQRQREGRGPPQWVSKELSAGRGLLALGPEEEECLAVDPSVLDQGVCHEEEALKAHGDASLLALGEYTGEELPAELVAEARAEELSAMEDWEVWDVVDWSLAKTVTGRPPLNGALGRREQG